MRARHASLSKNYNPKLSKRQRKPTAPERGHHQEENQMQFTKNETYILLELLHTAITGLMEDLNHGELSEQGAAVLNERYHDLQRIKRIIEEK